VPFYLIQKPSKSSLKSLLDKCCSDPSRYMHVRYYTTLVVIITNALTPKQCAQHRALFGLLPSGSCLLDLKCLYSRQGCVNGTQHFNVSQPSFLWCCSKLKFMTYTYLLQDFFLWHCDWIGSLTCLTKWTAGVCEQRSVSTAVSKQALGHPVSSPAWSLSLTCT
jgi:hypothetical protein